MLIWGMCLIDDLLMANGRFNVYRVLVRRLEGDLGTDGKLY
jgi:hypothetical protein